MLETKRLRCEPLQPQHAAQMFPVLSDTRIYTYLPGKPPLSLEALQRRYDFLSAGRSPDGSERWLNWILLLRLDGAAVGFWQATVHADHASIAYVLHPDYWGRGLASEASLALVSLLFDRFALSFLRAEIHFENQASHALVRRLGFQLEREDHEEGDAIYRLNRQDWHLAR